MKILSHGKNISFDGKSILHFINFEVAEHQFKAIIFEDNEITYVSKCQDGNGNELDIPIYFGKMFSSRVYNLLYNSI